MAELFERIPRRVPRAVRLLVAVAAVGLLALGVDASSAIAGEYHVYSCRTPSGEAAPVDGWSGSVSATSVGAITEDACSKPGGALIAALRGGYPRTANTNMATWEFAAPAGETLAGATLWRAGDAEGGQKINALYEFWLAGPSNVNESAIAFDTCFGAPECPKGIGNKSKPLAAENRVVVPGANLGPHLYLNATCGGDSGTACNEGEQDPNGYAAVIYLYAADLILEQSAPPSASDVSGELTSAPVLRGTSDVAFSASDPGSGVYEALFSVDGKVVQSTVLNENGGRCHNVGQTSDGLPAFLYAQPCPASVSADVGFDTTRVANGAHHLVVSVVDAAGNAATVLDRQVTIDNPPPPGGPNGTNASAQAALSVAWSTTARTGRARTGRARGGRLTSAYGHAQTIVGLLTGAGGAPIGDAQIDVLATPAYTGASATAIDGVRTDANGRFTLRLPAGISSCTLRFSYSAQFDTPPVATRTLVLAVRAGVALRVTPRTTSVGHSIRFSGRLLGGPIPHGGTPLVLEARSPGGAWLEFDVIRSDARGRFHAGYRFKFPGPAEYQFRVLCEAEADYPFATGASNLVGVFER